MIGNIKIPNNNQTENNINLKDYIKDLSWHTIPHIVNGYDASSQTTEIRGNNVWSDGDYVYCCSGGDRYVWNHSSKTWSVFNKYDYKTGYYIWKDGNNIYYGNGNADRNEVYNKSSRSWNSITWNGFNQIDGRYIWTDGDNIYYSYNSNQYVLDRSTNTWNAKTWNGYTPSSGSYIWTDGDNTYFSAGSSHYVLDKATSTWSTKTWNGLTSFNGQYIWTDGTNIYHSGTSTNNYYILEKSTNTWYYSSWYKYNSYAPGDYVWSDLEGNLYCDHDYYTIHIAAHSI